MSDRGEFPTRVVFHADDYGMSPAVNQGILIAFREGFLTSTAILANAPAAESACQQWPALVDDLESGALPSTAVRRQLAEPLEPFDLGVHLNLTQGSPLTGEKYPPRLLDAAGHFPGIAKTFTGLMRATNTEIQSVEAELHAQVSWVCDHGLQPTHLNGHQYIEMIPAVSPLIPTLLERFSIRTVRVALESGLLRNVLSRGDVAGWSLAMIKRHFAKSFRRRISSTPFKFPDRFFGTSHAGRIDASLVSRFLCQSTNAELVEIGVHPAILPKPENNLPDAPWFDPLATLRPQELEWLCSPKLANEMFERKMSLGRLGSPTECLVP